MKHFYLLSALALALPLSAAAQNTLTDADIANSYTTKTYSHRISCHDPSIVMDNITDPSNPVFYVYGSHLGHGETTEASNYQDWDDSWGAYEVAGTANSLFANAKGELINFADAYGTAHDWQYKGNSVQGMQWAPDIIYNKTMKKWCLYESLNGDYWCSSIVLFTSDSPKGPWVNAGIVNFSGFNGRFDHNGFNKGNDYTQTDYTKATGETSLNARYNIAQSRTTSWGNIYPNDIDPCVFYDDNDNLWMTYGSWSGGIFMLKLDPATGLRDYTYTYDYKTDKTVSTVGNGYNVLSDPYFGKKIAGGYYVSGEGSYIQKIGNYYFLFMSYGGLNPSQGYQMRVFRSTNPEGPYTDPDGKSAIYDNYAVNYGSNGTDNRGVLLMDGYKWETMPKGEVAQGHNSAFIDDKGRAFVVYHTKFNDGTFGHEVRVHELFLNEDGWLVAAPYEFHGETASINSVASSASVADDEIPGDYQFIRHKYNQSHAQVASDNQATTAKLQEAVNIKMNADGTVSGNETGTWTRKAGTDFITLTLSGVEYKGVLVKETIDYTNIPAVCIAALSDASGRGGTGTAQTRHQEVWASKADTKAAIKYTLDKLSREIPFSDGATINKNATLPTYTGSLGATVSWKSSDIDVYDDDFGEPVANGPVTLTLNINKDGKTYSKDYSLTVDMNGKASTPVYFPESSQKDVTAGWWSNFSDYYTVKAGDDAEFKFYNYSDKANNWDNWVLAVANGERGSNGYTEYVVLRNDNYGWQGAKNTTDNSWYTSMTSNYNWDTFKDEMDGSLVDMKVSYAEDGTFTMNATITAKSGNVYNYSFVMPIAAKPAQLTLFFVNEKSYIDGSNVPTGINEIKTDEGRVKNSATYNLNGQRVGNSYRGVIIKNGHKYIQR